MLKPSGVNDSRTTMRQTSDTLAIILGGGQGSRLFPLTATRSKPAVPIGGKYRLIDIPISGCLHADIRRIFVLTQFNSASLNRHISNTYRLDRFSGGFVEILAAEQTPDNPNWYQGTADAVRQAARHFSQHHADYYLILAGDHLYRMDYAELVDAHKRSGADITIAAQPVDLETATQMGIFRVRPRRQHRRLRGKAEAGTPRARSAAASPKAPRLPTHSDEQPFMASMGIYVFSRRVLLDMLEHEPGHDFGRELIPNALGRYKVKPYLFRGYWADVGTIESFYEANIMLGRLDSPFRFWDRGTADLHAPAASARLADAGLPRPRLDRRRGLLSRRAARSTVGRRRAHGSAGGLARHAIGAARRRLLRVRPAARRISRRSASAATSSLRSRDHRQERAHRRRRAAGQRTAASSTPTATAIYIRSGIIVVPKGGVITPGTVV